ncbi:MAG: hypothetical protein ACFB10_10785 [Salibacteraceae bacterium]
MRIALLLISFALFPLCSTGQVSNAVPGLVLKLSRLQEQPAANVAICGIVAPTESFAVVAKLRAQLSCNDGNPAANDYQTVKNQYAIYSVVDSQCQYFDSVYAQVEAYWVEQEAYSEKYNANGDFSKLFVRTGMMQVGPYFVPYISTKHEREGAFAIFWWKGRVYKIELVKSVGLGGLSSFLRQNLVLKHNQEALEFKGLVRQLEETKSLIAEQKKRCPNGN